MQILGIGQSQNRTVRGLERTNRALSKILNRLSTAQRINRASDDAAGLAVSEQLRTQIRGFKMATRNVADAMSALNIGEGASNEISDLLQRNRELAIQASSDTLTDEQREAIDVEFQQNLEEIDRLADTAQFNGQNVLNGTGLGSGNAVIQAGANEGETITLPEINLGVDPLGLTGVNVQTGTDAASAIGDIDTALGTLNSTRATMGATVNRLESAVRNLSVAEVNSQSAEEILRDQDMASGITDLTRERLLQETGMYAFGRYNEISANHIMSLLQ
ncbi:MAG: flagellin [Chitinivibrionales bacterium]|nr:flagellin [Chitinivibrionales bacterium]MBD3395147.1 flagellin [Chitinivibrionales bacterium]